MKRIALLTTVALLIAGLAWASAPVATPGDQAPSGKRGDIPAAKAFGDPTDLSAAAQAGADYLRYMQADITEDNAGNGDPDQDLEDGGWDWALSAFEHSASASPANLYGACAQGLYETYLIAPDAAQFTALKDAMDYIVTAGPSVIRSGSDIYMLVQFSNMEECDNPDFYLDGAVAIWDWRQANYGDGTAGGFAQYLADARAGQGYPNGIIPWDIGHYVEALALLDAARPGMGYGADADAMADVLYQDSFVSATPYFDPDGHSQGYDPEWNTRDYWWYTLGVSGLVRSLGSADWHAEEIPGLVQILLDSQYDDGAFSDQYGAQGGDADWQDSAYVLMALAKYAAPSAAVNQAIYDGAAWLAATQDASGGFVYSSGNHYPEVGAECVAAMALAWSLGGAELGISVSDEGPIDCTESVTATFSFAPSAGTPALRGYEITFAVTGNASFAAADVNDAGGLANIGMHAYFETDNGDGTFTVTDALLGATAGLTAAADLFTVVLTPDSDGDVSIDIVDYRLRELDNTPMFADLAGAAFSIDCTAPGAVTDIAAAIGHEAIVVTWAMADESDVDHYEIYRGMYYDADVAVSAYPEYDDLAGYTVPTRPADRAAADASAEWVLVGTAPAGTLTFTDAIVDRGAFDYEVFAVDATPLYGPAADANDWALNYFLGDIEVPYDGFVAAGDISQLGATFGLADGDLGYNNEADVGPTDDWSGSGFPQTDSLIDFEDLMIFALNYGQVGSAKASSDYDKTPPQLVWSEVGENVWSLVLSEPCSGLKGLRLTAPIEGQVRALPGALLSEQSGPVFFEVGEGLDVSVVVMGHGEGFLGAGELMRVEAIGQTELGQIAVDARGIDNAKLSGDVAGDVALPAAFAVRPNYPNPFNPMTTISFDLAKPGHVRVAIYDISGRLVRTLVSEDRAAGSHAVIWDGANEAGGRAASGQYLYRVTTDSHDVTRKMLMVK
jgi:hypothetical protein